MKEEWIKIPGYNNYNISNTGKIKNTKSKKILNPSNNTKGYIVVSLPKGKRIYLHRLVANLFLEKIKGKDQINHIDGNKTNNILSNLEWVTPKENIEHAYYLGLISKAKKLDPNTQDYKKKKIRAINIITNEELIFNSIKEATEKGFDRSRISECINGKLNKHKKHTWSQV